MKGGRCGRHWAKKQLGSLWLPKFQRVYQHIDGQPVQQKEVCGRAAGTVSAENVLLLARAPPACERLRQAHELFTADRVCLVTSAEARRLLQHTCAGSVRPQARL